MGLFFRVGSPINRAMLYYLVLLLAIPVLLRNTRLGFALIVVAIVLMYRSRTKGAREFARRRIDEEVPSPRMKAWKDPWGTGQK